MWEKTLNPAENVKLPDRENIDTGTRFCVSDKCPNVSQMSCPCPPKFPAPFKRVCSDGNWFLAAFRLPNLSELVPRIDEDALLLGRRPAAGARILVVGGADCDVAHTHVAFIGNRKTEQIFCSHPNSAFSTVNLKQKVRLCNYKLTLY